MPEVLIFKDETGRLAGFGEKDRRAYDKFRRVVGNLEPGELIQFRYTLPRSPQHHKFFFWRLAELLKRQEVFQELDYLLDWLKIGADFVHWVPSGGQLVPVPDSIAWEKLDEQQFTEVKRRMWDFLWTPEAQATLWPHLSPEKRHQMIDQWRREVDS